MPYADPEKQKQANRESKRRCRDRKTGGLPQPAIPFSPGVLVSAKDLDLSALAETIKAETDNLSHDGWLNLQGALGLEVLAIVRESLKSSLLVRSVKDVVQLLKVAQALIDPVIAAKGNLGGDDTIPSDLQKAHAEMLGLPGGIEGANQMMQLLSQAMLKDRRLN